MKLSRYTSEDIRVAVKYSWSIRQVLKKLEVVPAGGNYATLKKWIEYYEIDISHFKGQGWNKGNNYPAKRKTEDYLNNTFPIQSHKLKLRLLKEGIFDHKCYKCNLTIWNDVLIPIELEHINGNHSDNSLENLTLLCPNCHAQTSTYRGRNISKA